jgi:hypothetical protein
MGSLLPQVPSAKLVFMPAHKSLSDEQLDALMEEFWSSRIAVRDFCAEKKLAVPTFRRWLREWEVKREAARVANLPDKMLAWLPAPLNTGPYSRNGHSIESDSFSRTTLTLKAYRGHLSTSALIPDVVTDILTVASFFM